MNMNHCFQAGSVVPDLQSTDKFEALREVIRRARVFRVIDGRAKLEEAVIARERQQTTGFGHGVAVAHGRVQGVPRVLIALGVSRAGIAYDSPDGKPVRLLFVIASPPDLSLVYLQALSTLVRCIRDKDARDSLIGGGSAGEIEERLRFAFSAGLERFEEPLSGRQSRGSAG
jgi:mannitol/fructose-specific phosphotransferase system IIA component (Ntr-type)